MADLTMTGWRPGSQKVSLVSLLRTQCAMGLRDAKAVVDELLDGERVQLSFSDKKSRDTFRQAASQLGVEFD